MLWNEECKPISNYKLYFKLISSYIMSEKGFNSWCSASIPYFIIINKINVPCSFLFSEALHLCHIVFCAMTYLFLDRTMWKAFLSHWVWKSILLHSKQRKYVFSIFSYVGEWFSPLNSLILIPLYAFLRWIWLLFRTWLMRISKLWEYQWYAGREWVPNFFGHIFACS